jgi:hypothetical protein
VQVQAYSLKRAMNIGIGALQFKLLWCWLNLDHLSVPVCCNTNDQQSSSMSGA